MNQKVWIHIQTHWLLSVKRNIVKFDNNRSSTCRDISLRGYYKIQNGRQSAILSRKVSILSYTLHIVDRSNIVQFHNNRSSTCKYITLRRFAKIQDRCQSAILICKVSILGHTLLSIYRNNIVKFDNNRLSTCRNIWLHRFSRWPPIGHIDLQSINTWSYITL